MALSSFLFIGLDECATEKGARKAIEEVGKLFQAKMNLEKSEAGSQIISVKVGVYFVMKPLEEALEGYGFYPIPVE